MRLPVPDWLVTFVWFIAGIFGTGALWYFLSKDDYAGVAFSAFGALATAVVAITLQRVNDRGVRFRKLREQLSGFIKQAEALQSRKNETPLPTREHNEWVDNVTSQLGIILDSSYATRFNSFSGYTFYSDGSEKAKFSNSLEGRIRRLIEFIDDFQT